MHSSFTLLEVMRATGCALLLAKAAALLCFFGRSSSSLSSSSDSLSLDLLAACNTCRTWDRFVAKQNGSTITLYDNLAGCH